MTPGTHWQPAVDPSSFRDPSGFVYYEAGEIYRRVNTVYKGEYDHLLSSGLYDDLVSRGLLVPHTEVEMRTPRIQAAYKTLRPQRVGFVSYPYEWCFSQLKDAALTTLEIQERALHHSMVLKDSSAYNIQFLEGKPVLIDTLSFVRYQEGKPWIAYRQFCQHFLAPLALMSYRDARLLLMLRTFLDGIPIELASSVLPASTYIRPGLFMHLHLHAFTLNHHNEQNAVGTMKRKSFSARSFHGLIESLRNTIESLKWQGGGTGWEQYYDRNLALPEYLSQKKALVSRVIETVKPKTVWDLGSNVGLFSRICSDAGIDTISFDSEIACVEENYRQVKKRKETRLLPLCVDLANPSPSSDGRTQNGRRFWNEGAPTWRWH